MSPAMIRCALVALIIAVGCRAGDDGSRWVIVAGERVGPIGRETTEEDLAGLGAVERVPVWFGEGFCIEGTAAFAGTPEEILITWESEDYTRPASIRVTKAGSRWRTSSGIEIGMRLDELEALNGGPVAFSGFGWDYGGRLSSWEGGRLGEDHDLAESISVVVAPDPDSLYSLGMGSETRAVYGEQTVRSDHPLVRGLDVHVVEIETYLGTIPQERLRFCEQALEP